jgi:hypothetical protein
MNDQASLFAMFVGDDYLARLNELNKCREAKRKVVATRNAYFQAFTYGDRNAWRRADKELAALYNKYGKGGAS